MDKKTAFNQDIVLKLRQPSMEEVKLFKEGGILYSFLYPGQNKDLIDALVEEQALCAAVIGRLVAGTGMQVYSERQLL